MVLFSCSTIINLAHTLFCIFAWSQGTETVGRQNLEANSLINEPRHSELPNNNTVGHMNGARLKNCIRVVKEKLEQVKTFPYLPI